MLLLLCVKIRRSEVRSEHPRGDSEDGGQVPEGELLYPRFCVRSARGRHQDIGHGGVALRGQPHHHHRKGKLMSACPSNSCLAFSSERTEFRSQLINFCVIVRQDIC